MSRRGGPPTQGAAVGLSCERTIAGITPAGVSVPRTGSPNKVKGKLVSLPPPKGEVGGSFSLVDPASSHMLVSKLKPCKSQYKPN